MNKNSDDMDEIQKLVAMTFSPDQTPGAEMQPAKSKAEKPKKLSVMDSFLPLYLEAGYEFFTKKHPIRWNRRVVLSFTATALSVSYFAFVGFQLVRVASTKASLQKEIALAVAAPKLKHAPVRIFNHHEKRGEARGITLARAHVSEHPDSQVEGLFSAIQSGDTSRIRALLNTGWVRVNSARLNGHTPLVAAAQRGDLRVLKLLLEEEKADPNVRDAYGKTPLFYASRTHRKAVMKLLLDAGASAHSDRI